MDQKDDLKPWFSMIDDMDIDQLSWLRGHIQGRLEEIEKEKEALKKESEEKARYRQEALTKEKEDLEKVYEKIKGL